MVLEFIWLAVLTRSMQLAVMVMVVALVVGP